MGAFGNVLIMNRYLKHKGSQEVYQVDEREEDEREEEKEKITTGKRKSKIETI